MSHANRVAREQNAGVALNVAVTRRLFAGNAATDEVRDLVTLRVPELPWPLSFYFARWEEKETGVRGVSCVGFAIGEPLAKNAPEASDIDRIDVTAERLSILWQHFNRYRKMAQELRYPTEGNLAAAASTRATMRRHKGTPLSDDELVGVVNELMAHGGRRGAIMECASAHNVYRTTVYRWIDQAEQRGLVPAGVSLRQRRRPGRNT